MDYYFGNPNPPNPYYGHQYSAVNIAPSSDNFMVSDYLMLDDDDVVNVDHHHHQDSNWSQSTETESSENKAGSSDANIHGFGDETSPNNNNIKRKNGIMKSTAEVSPRRITFRTRSQLEIMDDGYKWRKYGKKSVKNSPNPRNYYKCSGEGCSVKKRVEREREDSSYVLTTYDGVHNHESPCTAYYNPMSLVGALQ